MLHLVFERAKAIGFFQLCKFDYSQVSNIDNTLRL